MKTGKFMMVLLLILFGSMALNAQRISHCGNDFHPGKQYYKQMKKGIRSGELTKREVRKLDKQIVKLERLKYKAQRDGWISRKEKKRVRRATLELHDMFRFYLNNNEFRHRRHGYYQRCR